MPTQPFTHNTKDLRLPSLQLTTADTMIITACHRIAEIKASGSPTMAQLAEKFCNPIDSPSNNQYPIQSSPTTDPSHLQTDEIIASGRIGNHASEEIHERDIVEESIPDGITREHWTPPPHFSNSSIRTTSSLVVSGMPAMVLPTSATKALELLLRYTAKTVQQHVVGSGECIDQQEQCIPLSLFPYSDRKNPFRTIKDIVDLWDNGNDKLPPMKQWKLDEQTKKTNTTKQRETAKKACWKAKWFVERYRTLGRMRAWTEAYGQASLTAIYGQHAHHKDK
jgi:hypothetical protein